MSKLKPPALLKKRTTRPKTVSMQFEELCACLGGQYTGISITCGDMTATVEGPSFMGMLATARAVSLRDAALRRTTSTSNYYVLDVP